MILMTQVRRGKKDQNFAYLYYLVLTGKLSRHHIQLPRSNYQNYQYSNLQHYHINTAHLHCNYHICKNWWYCICNHPGVRWIELMMPFDYYVIVWFTPSIFTKSRIMNTINVWCIKNRTNLSSKTLLSLVRFLLHQT